MINNSIGWLAEQPTVFDLLRWLLEGGYAGHRAIIDQHLRPNRGDEAQDWRVLDIGCGTGIYASNFDSAEYHGIDISQVYVDAAARKFADHTFETMDAKKLRFPDGAFDAAFISGVLHHLSDEDAVVVIAEALRVIGPRGRLVVWEDIPAPWWNLVGHLIHRLDLGEFIRKPDEYEELIRDAVTNVGFQPDSHANPIDVSRMRSGFMDYAIYSYGVDS